MVPCIHGRNNDQLGWGKPGTFVELFNILNDSSTVVEIRSHLIWIFILTLLFQLFHMN